MEEKNKEIKDPLRLPLDSSPLRTPHKDAQGDMGSEILFTSVQEAWLADCPREEQVCWLEGERRAPAKYS